MDISALERQRLFFCDTPRESHAEVARAFCDHGLTWQPGRVQTAMSHLRFEQVELFSLQYGAEVEVRPRSFEKFVLIHLSLAGILHVDSPGQSLDRRAGDAILLGRQSSLRMRWAEGTRQLILKIPKASLPDHLDIPSVVAFDAVQSRQLRGLLQALVCAAPAVQAGDASTSSWVAGLEDSILQFVVHVLKGPPHGGVGKHKAQIAIRDQRRVDHLLAYLRAHLGAPIGLEDMAKAADLSSRGLHLLCQRHLGCTPTSALRELRLDAVRSCLQQRADAAVTDIAMKHGFAHLGRFAQYYRERFGELPTETQRNRARCARAVA